ncbi:chromate transporter [soil metagenome]
MNPNDPPNPPTSVEAAESMTPAAIATPDEPTRRPASLTDLFLSFNRLALQGFGGVLPVAQRELVERQHWITNEQFVEMLSIGQVLPGPNIVNVSLMIGDRFFGLKGAFVALAGMLLSPLAVVIALAILYSEFARIPLVADALRGMGAVAAGLIIATALKLVRALKKNPIGMPLCLFYAALTVVAIAALRWPLVSVLLVLGPIGMATAWWRIR